MYWKKVLATMIAVLITLSSLVTTTAMAVTSIPDMPQGNTDLYSSSAGFVNAAIFGNGITYTHNAGVLSSSSKDAENSCILKTAITNLTQMANATDNSKVNTNDLSFVTKTKLTIQDIGPDGWKGAGVMLRYDASNQRRMMLRYAQDGKLRITGFNGTDVDYPITVDVPTAASMNIAVVQTKGTIDVFIDNTLYLSYTVPSAGVYYSMPYAFGLYSVYSQCNLSETSLYFSERVNMLSIPAMPQGNASLYNANAFFKNPNVNSNTVGFTHSAGVLASNSSAFENLAILNTAITGQTQVVNPADKSKVNIDTLTLVTKSKLTINSGADASWKGAGIVLRYDPSTNKNLNLRYSVDGTVRITGFNTVTDYLASVSVTPSSVMNFAVVQTKTSVDVFVNDVVVLNYTLTDATYLNMPYAFGHFSVYSVSQLTDTSFYFAQRMDNAVIPPMPQGNADLYSAAKGFTNANVYNNSVGYTHVAGVLASNSKLDQNSSVLNTSITGLTQMTNPVNSAKVNIDTLTYVTKSKLTITDIGAESWHGGGIILRYEPNSKKHMMLRYSQDGNLRITGFYGLTYDYLASVSVTPSSVMSFCVTQTKNTVSVSVNDTLVLSYTLPDDSAYLSTPYAFGLYSIFSVCNLTNTSLYFADRVDLCTVPAMPQSNATLYNAYAYFSNGDLYGGGSPTPYYTHSAGVLASTSKTFENSCVLNTGITGLTQAVNTNDNSKVNIDALTFVAKTKLTMEDIGDQSWHGAGLVLRCDPITRNRLMLRYFKDGTLRLMGFNPADSSTDYIYTLPNIIFSTETNIAVVQTKNTIDVYINNIPVLNYTIASGSAYLAMPYTFGLVSVYSVSKLTETSLYFAENASLVSAMPLGNANLYLENAGFIAPRIYDNAVNYTHIGGVLSSTSKNGENMAVVETAITRRSKMINPVNDSEINIDTMTYVTKTKLTITDIDSTSWYGAGVVLRYDDINGDRMMLRYLQSGTLMITGVNGANSEYLASIGVAQASEMNLTIVQTKNTITIYINNIPAINYTLPGNSPYLTTPYAFGIYSINSVCNLSASSAYFTDRVNSINILPNIGWTMNNGNMSGFVVDSKISALKSGIATTHVASIDVTENSIAVSDTSTIATGMIVKVTDSNNIVFQYTTIIYGDTSGDGQIGAFDLIGIKQSLLKVRTLEGAYAAAGDVNKDGEISLSDLLMEKKHILGLATITQ